MGFVRYLREKQIHRWGPDFVHHQLVRRRASRKVEGPRHLLFAICDHWEPLFGGAGDEQGDRRVATWRDTYPKVFASFRDADGHMPQHSFFFPGEHYRPRWLDTLADMSRAGMGEVELHLHHDGDTSASLAADVRRYVDEIAGHGHFARVNGAPRFAFIHGNWCLANARPDGRNCGVDDEVKLLHELGCYADLTFPAPEDPSHPRAVNQIFWPQGDLARRRAYEDGERSRVGKSYDDRLLFITGPNGFYLLGKKPRIEFGALMSSDPPTETRVKLWGDLGIAVEGRPEWTFVKLHTHGAPEKEAKTLLGAELVRMHELLKAHYDDGVRWKLHYVTAREMFNVARAAMDGRSGNPNDYRDYVLPKPPCRG
jgi:hypothetical protein